MTLEKEVWKKFKKSWLYHAERWEPGIGAGQPDVVLLDKLGKVGFVELKAPNRVALRASQWIWHDNWHKARGRSAMLTFEFEIWKVYQIDTKKRELYLICAGRQSLAFKVLAEELRLTI